MSRYVAKGFCFKFLINKFIGLGKYSRSWNICKIVTYRGICETRVIYIFDYLYIHMTSIVNSSHIFHCVSVKISKKPTLAAVMETSKQATVSLPEMGG